MQAAQRELLVSLFEKRFSQNLHRHPGVDWAEVHARLQGNPDGLKSLDAMEKTGGEPDVIGSVDEHGAFLFFDCAVESP
jgi:hypothetical protein